MEPKKFHYDRFLKQWVARRPHARLSVAQILRWADEHYRRHGKWPLMTSGKVEGALHENWLAINQALRDGYRGLEGGTTLARLLAEKRGVRNIQASPRLTENQILRWADEYHERLGRWPTAKSGRIKGTKYENWRAIDGALYVGHRGLKGGSSLARLLAAKRGVRNVQALPRLTTEKILQWADAHRRRTGKWPRVKSGPVLDAPGEKWANIEAALESGSRGLKGGSSVAKLLAEKRGVRNRQALPKLSVSQILAWADAHHQRTGKWPKRNSGEIPEAPGESWALIESALTKRQRGVSDKLSLARIWAHHRGARNKEARPPRGKQQRGTGGQLSLARIFAQHRGARNKQARPQLSIRQILQWADEHHARTGNWPRSDSGPIAGAEGETWNIITHDLYVGLRGLPKGSTILRLLAEHRGVPHPELRPPLTVKQILQWADLHHRTTGQWPRGKSGRIISAPEETWKKVNSALESGGRGLRRKTTLAQLLFEHRGVSPRKKNSKLSLQKVLAWADAHHRRTGRWPTKRSGVVREAPDERWSSINSALGRGTRGLPGGTTLKRFLAEHRSTKE
jgi:hypothetical protein